ncbi:MAG: sigma 54-interacting transcriptional regulator [Clostridiales bacterium]|nr:sigma 54-interacting transcriptional regulator [Clostridiales bacterium]
MNKESYAVTTSVIKKWDQKLFFNILDNIQDVVMVIDADTTIVYANEAYTKILGVPVQKVLGKRLDSIEATASAIKVLRTGEASHNQRDYISSVGIDVMGSGFPLFDGDRIIGCVAIFYNISEVVQLNRELQRTKGVADYLQDQLNRSGQLPISFKDYGSRNKRMLEILELAAKVARTDSTVLIRGESGVGKEVLAKAIHNSSKRKDKPLIMVNCAAIPETLLESELFGYEEGAFSGAKKGGKLGKFEIAHGGTIFLDEIGDMTLSMQAKLLRVLQEKELERVGGNKTIKLDIRVISATNRDLEKMVAEGTFRQDLFYRMSIVPIRIPPLRERKDDLPTLAEKLLNQISKDSGQEIYLTQEFMGILLEYDWPGNVRELQNVLEYAYVLRDGNTLDIGNLPLYLRPNIKAVTQVCDLSTADAVAAVAANDGVTDMKQAVEKVERIMIEASLKRNRNNRSKAILELGISRRSFYEKLEKYGIRI